MREIIKNIKDLKYKIKSCQMQKTEIEDPYRSTTASLSQRVAGGESKSPQEKLVEYSERLDKLLSVLYEQLECLMNQLREFLIANIKDYDCRLILEQRLIYDRPWKEIETLKFLSTSAKQNIYYQQLKRLNMAEGEKNNYDGI